MDAVYGFYGKLPSHGDFVRRALPDHFVEPWDRWLQGALSRSRLNAASASSESCFASSSWRFVLGTGLAGTEVWAGVMVPSVDRVGRRFPFCIAAGLSGDSSVFRCAALAHDWFDNAELIAASALSQDRNDLDAIYYNVMVETARLPLARRLRPSAMGQAMFPDDQRAWRLRLPRGAAIDLGMIDALEQIARQKFGRLALWWTDGSADVEPQWHCDQAWPEEEMLIGMLEGRPAEAVAPDHELPRPLEIQACKSYFPEPLQQEPVRLSLDEQHGGCSYSAAAWTDIGNVRHTNEDAFLVASEVGLWAVADGMGGHMHGDMASQMVVEALAGLSPEGEISDTVGHVVDKLKAVNGRLRGFASDPVHGFDTGATVVVLLLHGHQAAVVWVGDSRLYRLRDGVLEGLTKDHSTDAEVGAQETCSVLELLSSPTGELTRAVGGADTVEPESGLYRVESGDRFLLCTDGLYAEVAEAGLAAALRLGSADAAVAMLASHVQASAARDNATAVVVMVP